MEFGNQRVTPPCKAGGVPCAYRRPGCHDHCLSFQNYKKELEEAKNVVDSIRHDDMEWRYPKMRKYHGKWVFRMG